MKTVNSLTHWQCFVWLWRNDPEAKWFWFLRFLKGKHLNPAIQDNLTTFGIFPKS